MSIFQENKKTQIAQQILALKTSAMRQVDAIEREIKALNEIKLEAQKTGVLSTDEISEVDGIIAEIQVAIQEIIGMSLPIIIPNKLSYFQFLKSFTVDERISIKEQAKTDPKIAIFIEDIEMLKEVDLNDPEIISGLDYLAKIGIITKARKMEIIT